MKKQQLLIGLVLFFVVAVFFYPIFKNSIPFPGDLLVSAAPYSTYSYSGFAPGGVPNKGQDPDVLHELFPWKYFVIDSLKHGQIPFWTPYNFSGNTIMANFQSNVFYPINLVFFLLPFLTAWTVYIFISPLLAAIFTYLFLSELKLSRWSAVFGGIIFAFSSYMVVWLEYGNITHTFLWLPLALYFTEKYIQKYKWYIVLSLTVTLWLAFLAGYIQGFFYLLVITFAYFVTKVPIFDKKNLKKIAVFFLALIFPILLSLFQLLPTLSLFSISSRGNYTLQQITQLLNPWWYSMTVIMADFFGNPATRNYWFSGTYIERVSYFGVIPFFFALSSLFSLKTKEVRVFSVLFVISFLLSIDLFITRYIYLLPTPFLSTTVPTRVLSVFVFSGAVLSSFGLEFFIQGKQRRQLFAASIIGVVVLIIAWGFVFFGPHLFKTVDSANIAITKHNIILPTVFTLIFITITILRFLNFIRKKRYAIAIALLILFVVTIGDLFYFFQKITPFSPKLFVYPKTAVISYLQEHGEISRYWGYGSASIASNFQTYDKTFSPEGFDALHIKQYTEFISASKDSKLPVVISRDNAAIAPGYGSNDLYNNSYRQKALNITGVKYLLFRDDSLGGTYHPDSTFPSTVYKLIWQQKPWQIYENLQTVPRFFLTADYLVEPDKAKSLSMLYSPEFDERKNIIVDQDPHLERVHLDNPSVKLLSYTPNKVVIQATVNADALLFFSDTYSPNWQASVDEVATRVLIADYAYRAVVVPKGQHRVTFFYNDKEFKTGLVLSVFFGMGFVLFLVFLKKQKSIT